MKKNFKLICVTATALASPAHTHKHSLHIHTAHGHKPITRVNDAMPLTNRLVSVVRFSALHIHCKNVCEIKRKREFDIKLLMSDSYSVSQAHKFHSSAKRRILFSELLVSLFWAIFLLPSLFLSQLAHISFFTLSRPQHNDATTKSKCARKKFPIFGSFVCELANDPFALRNFASFIYLRAFCLQRTAAHFGV